MKKIPLLFICLILCLVAFSQEIDTTFNAPNFAKAIKEVNNYAALKTQLLWAIGIATTVLGILGFFGGKALLDSAITKMLADKLHVKKEHLEEMLKELTKDYDAKNNRKILIVSNHSETTIAELRTLLLAGGIKNGNFAFQGINDTLNLVDKDVILFNDAKNSAISPSDIESFIARYKNQVKSYFYFGKSNDLPLQRWKEQYGVSMGAANLDEKLVGGLITFFKTIV
jgi:hypothetical protein